MPDARRPTDMQRSRPVALILLMLVGMAFSGCFGDEEPDPEPPDLNAPFQFMDEIPATTWYHFPGNVSEKEPLDATDPALWGWLDGDNWPFLATGTYFGMTADTFEPTIGITSDGDLVMTNHRGAGDGTHIYRTQDGGLTWEDVGPFNQVFPQTGQTLNSNDPYVYVDPWTDRIVKFDMHALTAMFVEFSDDGGDTWSLPASADGYYSPQDHQSIASMPDVGGLGSYPTIYVFCINTGSSAVGPQCSRSLTGGVGWDIQRPGYPVGVPQCSGLHGHLVGSEDGNIYRGNPSCDGPAVYRSTDGGYTWSEHTVTTEIGTQSHEIATATDAVGNVYAHWIGDDQLPWFAASSDAGDTWTEPMMVAPPSGISATGFPTITAGAEGRVAISYIGIEENEGMWNGYISVMTDAFAEHPLITTVAVNTIDDPLDTTDNCGSVRCGGFGDFIDIELDDFGRPYAALAHNVYGDEGLIGTWVEGPALHGDLVPLPPGPVGGPSTLSGL